MQYFPVSIRATQIFALVLIIAAMACGSASEGGSNLISADEGGIVEADGGLITIEVPAGALSEDIEITVSKFENDFTGPGDLPALAAYELGPEGTTFL